MESKIRRSRGVDRVMTVIFYLVAIFFFALLIGFAGKVIIGGLMGAKPEMFRFARKGSIGNQLFNTIYLVFISLLVSIPLGVCAGIYLDGDQIILKTEKEEIPIVKTGELKILGRHNHENVMAAAAMAYYAGVSVESIRRSVCEFVAVPHRIEYVTEKNGVAYYNDSKGTNPDAAIKGIQAMNRPTLLIGGGYDKESSYDEWIESFDGKVRYLVLIGQTKEKIKEVAERLGFTDIILCEDLKEAVRVCAEKANPGDAVLLSPACASWGQFDNYEQRGDMFKEYVKAL